jgi:hypothetical protein
VTPNQHRERAERLAAEIRNQVDEILCDEGREELDIVNTLCAAFAEVEAESVPRWIDVGERLPEKGMMVLLHCVEREGRGSKRTLGFYDSGEWFTEAPIDNFPVTHWQPLPPAPTTPKEQP